jgi:AcrR family transcriptional regulator
MLLKQQLPPKIDILRKMATPVANPVATPQPPCGELLDPRIRRTRDLLQQSLSTLLETAEFEKLSVLDITEAAGVNRATFYAHYPDKFALLECLVAGRFQALLAARGVVFDGTCSHAVRGIILGVCDYVAQTLAHTPGAQTPDTDTVPRRQLEPHLESAVVAVVRGMLLHGLQQHPADAPNPPELLAATAAWAIYGAAKEWVRTPNRPTSDAIAQNIFHLVSPILFPLPR